MALETCAVRSDESRQELTQHGTPALPAACYREELPETVVALHWHEEFEFILAAHGQIHLRLDTEEVVLPQGGAVFLLPGCLHAAANPPDVHAVLQSLVIHPKFIGGSLDSFFRQQFILPLVERTDMHYIILDGTKARYAEVIAAMCAAWRCFSEEPYDYENEARFYITRAVHILKDALPEVAAPAAHLAVVERMKPVLQYIEQHYAEDISLAVLTRQAVCSESVLLRDFRKVTGMPPMRYVLSLRLEKAAALLLSTEMKSAEIAVQCGFNDISYFTRAFRSKTGLAPQAYRKQHAEKLTHT